MTRRRVCLFLVLVALNVLRLDAAGQGPRTMAHPVFDGIWNSGTATPLERPSQLKDQAFFTPEEALAWERRVAESNREPSPEAASKSTDRKSVV